MQESPIYSSIEQELQQDPTRALLLQSEKQITSAYRQATKDGQPNPVIFVLDLDCPAARTCARRLKEHSQSAQLLIQDHGEELKTVSVICIPEKAALKIAPDQNLRSLLDEKIFPDRYKIIAHSSADRRAVSWPRPTAVLHEPLKADKHEASHLLLALGAFLYLLACLVYLFHPFSMQRSVDLSVTWPVHLVFWIGIALHLLAKGTFFALVDAIVACIGLVVLINLLGIPELRYEPVIYFSIGGILSLAAAATVKLMESRQGAVEVKRNDAEPLHGLMPISLVPAGGTARFVR